MRNAFICGYYRDEIASCIECSFKKVSQKDAAQLLLFNNVSEVVPFAKKVPYINWICFSYITRFLYLQLF